MTGFRDSGRPDHRRWKSRRLTRSESWKTKSPLWWERALVVKAGLVPSPATAGRQDRIPR